MAWRWWRRRWKPRRRPAWTKYRRRRWRRFRPRRPRRSTRRRGRRRTVRRRRVRRLRRRRGWTRRRYLRRRKRRKLVLTQWNPSTVRRCNIRGIIPLIMCGANTASFNYGMHSDDSTPQPEKFGGGMSTVTFSLYVLYDQFTRHMNRWSYPNDQLDLARYKGCSFKMYRHPTTDFILTYDNNPPMKNTIYSSPNTHPGILMQQKHRVLIPSWLTFPKGRKYVKIKIPPPKLFEDHWYTQPDLCKVPLVTLRSTAADFRHPFCSPQTNNPCTTFQVLREPYNEVIGLPFTADHSTQTPPTPIKEFEKWLYSSSVHYQTFQTEQMFRPRPNNPDGSNNNKYQTLFSTWTSKIYHKKTDSNFGYTSYDFSGEQGYQYATQMRQWYWTQLTTLTSTVPHINPTYSNAITPEYEYHTGWFSPVFIGPSRHNIQFRTAYMDVTYNPLNDKGQFNRVWFQYSTKPNTHFNPMQCKCLLENIPLWSALFGYSEYVESQLGPFQDHETVGLVVVQCPYTVPPMYNKENKDMGYIFYDTNFGNGKLGNGSGQVPRYWQQRWYPILKRQRQVMNDICKTGPFSYRDELLQVDLAASYTFRFNWGGDSLYHQVIKNPCDSSGLAPTDSGRFKRDVQVVSPLTMGPRLVFHSFDQRRGFFTERAIKRMHDEQIDVPDFTQQPKIPRIFPPVELQDQREQAEEDSSSETFSLTSSQAKEAEAQESLPVQQQLRKQLRQQQQLRVHLQHLFLQLQKTKAHLHLNPLFFPQENM
nr:MAG: ORF1 [Torque teno virus]